MTIPARPLPGPARLSCAPGWREAGQSCSATSGSRRAGARSAPVPRAAAELARPDAHARIRLPLGRFDPRDDESWEALEEALISADVGMAATDELVERLRKRRGRRRSRAGARRGDRGAARRDRHPGRQERPSVVLVVGVNGTGKTTTIGKLAYRLSEHGRSVLVAAADTFRAAADEQLEIWSQRAGADFVGSRKGADPPRSRTTRSRRPRAAAATSSSSTPPAGCTRRRT